MQHNQADIDGAYAVKIYLDYHPHPTLSIPVLAEKTQLPADRLLDVFYSQFQIPLENYLKQCVEV